MMFGSIRSASEDTSDWDDHIRRTAPPQHQHHHRRTPSGQEMTTTPSTPASPFPCFEDNDHCEITRSGILTKKKEKIISQEVTDGEYILTGISDNDGKFNIQIKLSYKGKTFLDIRQDWDGTTPQPMGQSILSSSWDPSPKLSRSPQMSSPLSSSAFAPSARSVYEQRFFVANTQNPSQFELTLARISGDKSTRKSGSPFVSTPSSILSTSPPFSSYLSAREREAPTNPQYNFRLIKVQCQPNTIPQATPEFRWKKSDSIIGRGALGTVYLGINLNTGELMAIKQVDVNSKNFKSEALESEINYLKALSHPNIVRYLGMQRTAKYIDIFLEYVPGGSIESLLQKFKHFPESIVQLFSRQILLGLQYLHEHGVLHRDIKGGNILVDKNGTIKLSDFGSAKMIDVDLDPNEKKQITGTPPFMPKEVIRDAKYSNASDIWSFGCTVLQMLTGQHPWSHLPNLNTPVAVMFHIANTNETPLIPDWISDTAKSFLNCCFQLDPNDRPSAAQLLNHPFMKEKIEPPPNSHASISNSASNDADLSGDGDSSSSSFGSVNESVSSEIGTDARLGQSMGSSAMSYGTPNEELSLDILRSSFNSAVESFPMKIPTQSSNSSLDGEPRRSLDAARPPAHTSRQRSPMGPPSAIPTQQMQASPTDRKLASSNLNAGSDAGTSSATNSQNNAGRPRAVSANSASKCCPKLFGSTSPRNQSGQTSPQPSASPRQAQFKSPFPPSPTTPAASGGQQAHHQPSHLTWHQIFRWLSNHGGKISARSVLDPDSVEDEIPL